MENNILDEDQDSGTGKINVLSNEAFGFIKEIKRWSKVLSVIGFVVIGILIVVAFLAESYLKIGANTAPASLITVVYIFLALLYFMPTYYLFQFSTKMGKAYKMNSPAYVTEAFKNLKSSFKYVGILTLVLIIFYGGIFIIAFLVKFAKLF